MRARILTLRFSPELGGFDDRALQQLGQQHDLLSLREHVVVVDDQPCLACVVTWQERGGAPAAPASVEAAAAKAPTTTNGAARPVPDILADLNDTQRARFETIRQWRSQTARHEGVPPYVVLTNRQLVEIVKRGPTTRAGLGRVDGLGDKKLDRYAEPLLALLHPPVEAPGAAAAKASA